MAVRPQIKDMPRAVVGHAHQRIVRRHLRIVAVSRAAGGQKII
jgi:hypothetical protein